MFERNPESKWVQDLSKEVSAFANTEGGQLVLGIDEEKRTKPRVAKSIDGLPTSIAPERLQQLIEGNLSPYLPGIRVQRVSLSDHADRVVFVINVPQGVTAYQANDGRYYGRSEFEAKYLPDHEIRLRMERGKVAQMSINFRLKSVNLSTEYETELRGQHSTAIEAFKKDASEALIQYPALWDLIGAKYNPDKISFDFVVKNEGEQTIRNPNVEIRIVQSKKLLKQLGSQTQEKYSRFEMNGSVIYPGDTKAIDGSKQEVFFKKEIILVEGDYVVHWKAFLDNSPPSIGVIDISTEIQQSRN